MKTFWDIWPQFTTFQAPDATFHAYAIVLTTFLWWTVAIWEKTWSMNWRAFVGWRWLSERERVLLPTESLVELKSVGSRIWMTSSSSSALWLGSSNSSRNKKFRTSVCVMTLSGSYNKFRSMLFADSRIPSEISWG